MVNQALLSKGARFVLPVAMRDGRCERKHGDILGARNARLQTISLNCSAEHLRQHGLDDLAAGDGKRAAFQIVNERICSEAE